MALAIAFIFYLECFVNPNKDLDVFIGASRLVAEGKNCYDVWLHSGTSGLKYFYSPLFAVLLFPLNDLPQVAYNFAWLSLNLLVVYRLFLLLPYFFDLSRLSDTKRQLFYLFTFILSSRFFYDCFSLGQMTFILLWGSLESLRLITTGKKAAGSALLALVINIKLLPVAVLAYLVYRRELRAAALTLGFFFLTLLLPGFIIGFGFNSTLLANWYASITATSAGSITDDYGRQSLSSFVPALLMETPMQFGIRRNVLSLQPQQVMVILNGLRMLLLIVLVWLFGKPFQNTGTRHKLFYDLALICLVTPLFFPHQGKYSFFYLMPAYAYGIYHWLLTTEPGGQRMPKRALWLLILSFVFLTLTTDGLIGRRLSDLCEYLQLITIGSFCLLAALILLKPKAVG